MRIFRTQIQHFKLNTSHAFTSLLRSSWSKSVLQRTYEEDHCQSYKLFAFALYTWWRILSWALLPLWSLWKHSRKVTTAVWKATEDIKKRRHPPFPVRGPISHCDATTATVTAGLLVVIDERFRIFSRKATKYEHVCVLVNVCQRDCISACI